MCPVSRREFDALLCGLTGADLEQFVVDLWTARGREVVREGDLLVATDRLGTERRLAVRRSFGWHTPSVPRAADLLVTPDEDATHPDGRVVGPTELFRLFSYAISPEAQAAIHASTLAAGRSGRSPGSWARRAVSALGPVGPGLSRRGAPTATPTAASRAGALLAVSLALLVVGGSLLLGAPVLGLGGGGPASVPPAAGTTPVPDGGSDDSPSSPAAAAGTSPGVRPTTAGGSGTNGTFPPGIAADGSIDENALAAAHLGALVGRSYRLEVTYREFEYGEPTALEREVVVVESPTVYATTRSTLGTPARGGYLVSNVEAYADGTTRFERTRGGADPGYRAIPVAPAVDGTSRYADRAAAYIRWFLSVRESRVVDSVEAEQRSYYWLSFRGDPWPGVENAAGGAVVDSSGFVHELRRTYDVPGQPGVSAVVSVHYTEIGGVTVDPPTWHGAARNATQRGTNATWTDTPTTPSETAETNETRG